MKKRIFSLFVCAALLMCSAVGCGKEESSAGDSSAAEYQTMEPPEDGWTIEELLSVTYLCDTQLSYPLTLASLGDNFSLNADEMSYRETEKSVIAGLLYNGNTCATIWQMSTNKFSEITNDMPIDAIEINSFSTGIEQPVVINGITFQADAEEVTAAFGEPDEVYDDDSIVTYYLNHDESKTLAFTFDSGALIDVQFSLTN